MSAENATKLQSAPTAPSKYAPTASGNHEKLKVAFLHLELLFITSGGVSPKNIFEKFTFFLNFQLHRVHEVIEGEKFAEVKRAEFAEEVDECKSRMDAEAEKLSEKFSSYMTSRTESVKDQLSRMVENFQPNSNLNELRAKMSKLEMREMRYSGTMNAAIDTRMESIG